MTRGELYRVFKPGGDPKQYRIFALVSRQVLIDSKFSSRMAKGYRRKSRLIWKKK